MKLRDGILAFLMLFLCSCASLPKPLQDTPALKDVSFNMVKNNPDKYLNVSLLWGGKITNCINYEDGTVFELLYLPLGKDGYPMETDASEGRFLAKSKNFLDCAVYTKGRYLTVIGKLKGFQEGKIDKMSYNFPILECEATYLWKKRTPYYPNWRPYLWFWYGHPPFIFEYGPW